LVAYLLNMICECYNFYTKLHKYEISYKFDTVVYQFLETGTSDRFLYVSFNISFFLKSLFQRHLEVLFEF